MNSLLDASPFIKVLNCNLCCLERLGRVLWRTLAPPGEHVAKKQYDVFTIDRYDSGRTRSQGSIVRGIRRLADPLQHL